MEKSSFFNSINGDRKYKAEEWAAYFASFIGNGVFPIPSTGLQVVANGNMSITVRAGKAWIHGYFYLNTADFNITLDNADGVYSRIDRVVVRWDLQRRDIRVQVKKGKYTTTPIVQTLQRDADAYEIALADIYVGAGVVKLTQSNITDQRLDNNLCGMVAGVVNQIDTTTFNAQLQAWFNEFKHDTTQDYELFAAQLQTWIAAFKLDMEAFKLGNARDYEEWFEAFKAGTVFDHDSWYAELQLILDTANAIASESGIMEAVNRIPFISSFTFTIAVADWQQDGENGFIGDVLWDRFLETDAVNINFDGVSLEAAGDCGLSEVVQVLDGKLRFTTENKPEVALQGECLVFREGGKYLDADALMTNDNDIDALFS